ncbi:MAG TPA: YqgE/AlgH family protein [Bacteroidales bacterium]|jgi:putative transcriptional regulator|nr:YqgE/AlgH family protein [Bacteroidales bacterium]HBZ20787.1 YqgE/AlgH family protein [Bacteroidales bacterium]
MKPEIDLFAILPEDKIPEKGKILISEPFLPDTFFNRTVVYLTDHNPKGSVGFILNKKLDLRICDTVSGFEGWEENLNMGGPVAPDTLHYIHDLGHLIPQSVRVEGNIFWGGDIDAIRNLIRTGSVKPGQIRFFLGYSGWSAGQLERELKENSWVISKVNSEVIMNTTGGDSWKRLLRSFKNKYRVWADFPDSPDMN